MMIGLRLATIKKQIKAGSPTPSFNRPAPGKSVYIQIVPSTTRYHKLMTLAEQHNMSYHTLALIALDWFLEQNQLRNI